MIAVHPVGGTSLPPESIFEKAVLDRASLNAREEKA